MDLAYLIVPFLAWLLAGSTKFTVNSLKARRLAFDLIGYGGMPSNHTAIVTSIAGLIALREGFTEPAFGLAVALAFIVMLDASSLRKQVGRQAQVLNQVAESLGKPAGLRERMGHSRLELLAGAVVGVVAAYAVHLFPV